MENPYNISENLELQTLFEVAIETLTDKEIEEVTNTIQAYLPSLDLLAA